MVKLFKRPKKVSDFQRVIEQLDALEVSLARLRQDIRIIIREEICRAMREHSRKGWSQIL